MGRLPNKALIQYGNVIFPVAYHISLSARDVLDDSGRTIKWVEYVYTIIADVAAKNQLGQSVVTGPHLSTIVRTLSTPALPLVIAGTGFPDLVLNTGDQEWGPMPQLLGWKPLSGPLATQVTWTVKVCLAPCDVAPGRNVAAYGYSIVYAINRGYTTRTVNAHLELGMSRVPGTRQIPDTVDNHLNLIIPRIPTGFFRETTSRTISLDKRRMDVSFVDREVQSENPYPANMVDIDVDITYRNEESHVDVSWIVDLSAKIEIPLGMTARLAHVVFAAHCQALINSLRNRANAATVLPLNIQVNEPVYGKVNAFSMTMLVIKADQPILTAAGYGNAMHNGTWDDWRISLETARTFHEQGYCGLQHNRNDDSIVDLCGGTPLTPQENCIMTTTVNTGGDTTILVPVPPEESSYIKSKVEVIPQRDDHILKHSILQPFQEGDAVLPDYDTLDSTGTIMGAGGGTAAVIQSTTNPDSKVALKFDLIRAEHKPVIPTLRAPGDAGGVVPHRRMLLGGGVELMRKIGEIPIYRMKGIVEYDLDHTPTAEVPPKINHKMSGAAGAFLKATGTGAATPR